MRCNDFAVVLAMISIFSCYAASYNCSSTGNWTQKIHGVSSPARSTAFAFMASYCSSSISFLACKQPQASEQPERLAWETS